jgi:hypothetical protein
MDSDVQRVSFMFKELSDSVKHTQLNDVERIKKELQLLLDDFPFALRYLRQCFINSRDYDPLHEVFAISCVNKIFCSKLKTTSDFNDSYQALQSYTILLCEIYCKSSHVRTKSEIRDFVKGLIDHKVESISSLFIRHHGTPTFYKHFEQLGYRKTISDYNSRKK